MPGVGGWGRWGERFKCRIQSLGEEIDQNNGGYQDLRYAVLEEQGEIKKSRTSKVVHPGT